MHQKYVYTFMYTIAHSLKASVRCQVVFDHSPCPAPLTNATVNAYSV